MDGTTEITFDPVQAAYVRLTATRSYHWQESSANTVMTVAEFEIFEYVVPPMEPDDDSRDIPLSALTVSTGDYETDGGATEGPAELAVDNDPDTLWHTDWYGTSRENHWFQFELTETYRVDGLRYWPRQAGNANGTITKYEIQVSNDGVNFETVASGDWENDRNWKIVQFDGQNVKYVRLVAVDAVTDNSYVFASASEIRLTGVKTGEQSHVHEWSDWTVTTEPTCTEAGVETRSCECGETETRETAALGHDFVDGVCTICGEAEEQPSVSEKLTGVTGEGSSTDTSEPAFDKSVGNAFDGDYATFWATVPGGTLADAWLIADLGGVYTIDKVEYTKRYDSGALYNCTGNLLDYIIEVSTDGETWTQVAAGDTVDGTTEITFDPVQAAYVRLTATRSYHWQAENANTVMTVAEMAVFGTAAAVHEHTAEEAVTENEVAATCTEDGSYDSVVYCAECGEEISRETVVVPATGHNYEDGVCTECGEEDPDYVPEAEVVATGWSGYTIWTLTNDGVLTFVPSGQLENGQCNLRNYWKVDGVLTLPWGAYAEQITKVVISDGIHDIGQMAFYALPNLAAVELGADVTEIRNYAFKNCVSLTAINLDGVYYIREGAFYGCASLTDVTLAEGVTVEEWAFTRSGVTLN